jgi:hypothetical protein
MPRISASLKRKSSPCGTPRTLRTSSRLDHNKHLIVRSIAFDPQIDCFRLINQLLSIRRSIAFDPGVDQSAAPRFLYFGSASPGKLAVALIRY